MESEMKHIGSPPMIFDSPTERYFLSDFRAHWISQGNLGQIGFSGDYSSTRAQRSNVHQQYL